MLVFIYLTCLVKSSPYIYVVLTFYSGSGKYTLFMSKDKRLECFMIDIKIKHGWLYYIKLLLAEWEYFRPPTIKVIEPITTCKSDSLYSLRWLIDLSWLRYEDMC